jgi:integrase
MKAVLAHAEDAGLGGAGLSRRIKLSDPRNAREVFLSKQEVAELAKGMAQDKGKAAVGLLAYCGPRISELLAHPKARDNRLHFPKRTTKNSTARIVPVPKAAQKHLWCLPLADAYPTYQAFYDEFCAAKEAAGLAHVNIHDLRHTCASWLINEGVDLYTVAKILGDTLQTAQRYAHLVTGTLEKAMARLG